MRKSTFRKISVVFLVFALGVLMLHRIHRVVARHARIYHTATSASQPRNTVRVNTSPSVADSAASAPLADWVSTQLTGRLDFCQSNDASLPDAFFFGPGAEPAHTNALPLRR